MPLHDRGKPAGQWAVGRGRRALEYLTHGRPACLAARHCGIQGGLFGGMVFFQRGAGMECVYLERESCHLGVCMSIVAGLEKNRVLINAEGVL